MWNNAALMSGVTLLLIGISIWRQMNFLIPFRRLLFHQHGIHMAVYAVLLSINIMALYLWIARKLMLKDSGSKMQHTIKQVRDGKLMGDLAQRLEKRG